MLKNIKFMKIWNEQEEKEESKFISLTMTLS